MSQVDVGRIETSRSGVGGRFVETDLPLLVEGVYCTVFFLVPVSGVFKMDLGCCTTAFFGLAPPV